MTFGIAPAGPETGYGYIQRGAALYENAPAFSVRRFVEKPDSPTAAALYRERAIITGTAACSRSRPRAFWPNWNGWSRRCSPAAAPPFADGKRDLDFFRLDPKAFDACKSISIDYAVMEHTQKAAIVPVEMGWSDIGSWEALWDASDKDDVGNALKGDVLHHGARNSYLRSEGPMIAAVGVEDLVVVATADAVLVSRKNSFAGRQEDRRTAGTRQQRAACHPPQGLPALGRL